MFKGFRDFMLRGNVVDLAVAVVIGAAFTALIAAFTKAFIEPLIRLVLPGNGLDAGVVTIGGEKFDTTLMINALITFIVTAAVVYFFFVVPVTRLRERSAPAEEEPGVTEIDLLTEIRDALRAQQPGLSARLDRPGDAPQT